MGLLGDFSGRKPSKPNKGEIAEPVIADGNGKAIASFNRADN
jgi:hypothetical protein